MVISMTDIDTAILELEQKAADLVKLLNSRQAKRPLIIEFSGSPKAGKTMAISVLRLFLRRNGIRVETFAERASVAPMTTKGHINFNVWVSCASLQGMLEALEKDIDIFIVDRGLFDALIWNQWLEMTGKITTSEAQVVSSFFTMERWLHLIDLVCIMKCSPKASIEREYANQLTTKRGAIMDETILAQLNESISHTTNKYRENFKRVYEIDTTSIVPRDGVTKITKETLSILQDFLDEPLCVIPKKALDFEIPAYGFVNDRHKAELFSQLVVKHGTFLPRSIAERDPKYLIPIPCAIIMFQGQVLVLKRKEQGHSLHDTYAIWAGGHVVKSDESDSGIDGILKKALDRELSEEIFIRDEFETLQLGLVRTSEDERAARHIGIVYRADLSSPHVALALHQKEFRETKGKSMSGRLVPSERLVEIYDEMGDWSRYIVDEFWPGQKDLFKSTPDQT
jgi:predicted NUDIX family phosphoesterase